MKRVTVVSFLSVLVIGALACTSVKPIPIIAGDVCSRCRRTIVDPALAGEIINDHYYATKYRTPACMAQYLKEHPEETIKAIYVTDYKNGRLISATNAYFVKTEIDPFTKETDFAAFLTSAEAVAFGAPTGTKPIDWDGVKQFVSAKLGN